MPVAVINLGDSETTVKIKILNILTYHGISTSGITSWGVARSRLNQAANLVLLPTLEDGMDGDIIRTRTNSLALSEAASDPINTVLPVISGTAAFGQTLSVSNGTWTGYPVPTYTYQWKRGGVDIAGATDDEYTLVTADIGQIITASVVGTNTGGSITATSNATANVVAPPVNTVIPIISGVAAMGQILTTNNGTWTGYPIPTYTYQWKADGVNISGATNNNYTLTASELGKVITVNVTGTNTQGNSTATSTATVAVVSTPVNTAIPVISGSAVSGQTLSTTNGTWNAYPAPTYTYQWKADGVNISGATNNTFLLTDTQAGTNITVTVTATNSQGSASSNSNMTSIVKPSWMTQDLNLFADFVNNRYWNDDVVTSSIFTDTHPETILIPNGSGSYISKGINEFSNGYVVPTRTNLARYSFDVTNAAWIASVTKAAAGSQTSPDGAVAVQLTETSAVGATFGLEMNSGVAVVSTAYTISAVVKRKDVDWVMMILNDGTSQYYVNFNINTGTVGNGSGATGSVVALADGWFRLSITATTSSTATQVLYRFRLQRTAGNAAIPSTTYNGDGVSGVYVGSMQIEQGTFATPPIVTTSAAVTRTGNVLKTSLPSGAQTGVAGYIKVDQIGFNPTNLPVILGLNPASQVAQTLVDAVSDLGTVTSGLRTIVFAASPGYTKVRILGGSDVAATAGDFEDDIVSVSLGGNGFNANNNQYASFKLLALKYGPQNDTTFNAMYGIAT